MTNKSNSSIKNNKVAQNNAKQSSRTRSHFTRPSQRQNIPVSKSVGAVVLNGRNQVLLVFQNQNKYWEFPKGKMEAGERELDTLKREIFEETGIKQYHMHKNFRRSMNYFFRYQGNPIKRKVVYYLIKTSDRVKISDEHLEYAWLSIDRAKERIKHKNQKMMLDEVKKTLYGK